jgi:hypothetical protein
MLHNYSSPCFVSQGYSKTESTYSLVFSDLDCYIESGRVGILAGRQIPYPPPIQPELPELRTCPHQFDERTGLFSSVDVGAQRNRLTLADYSGTYLHLAILQLRGKTSPHQLLKKCCA